MIRVYPMRPCPAPRQTRRDAYKPRPAVLRYHAFRDEVRIRHVQIPAPFFHVLFVLQMPRSWSEVTKLLHRGMPHQQKPDKDNLEKALLDSVFRQDTGAVDCHVWDGRATKVWGDWDLIAISNQAIDLTLPIDTKRLQDMATAPYTQAQHIGTTRHNPVGCTDASQDPLPQGTQPEGPRCQA